MFSDEYFMKQALREAMIAMSKDEVPVGAVIVCNDQIIARAHNLTETLNDVTAHAEMQAFTAAANYLGGKYLTGCTLYVTVEPCAMCAGAAMWTQIPRIVYGTPDDKKGYSLFSRRILHPKTEVHAGIMSDECAEMMREYFKRKRDL